MRALWGRCPQFGELARSESPPSEAEKIGPSEVEVTPELVEAVAQHIVHVEGFSFEYSRIAPLPTHEELAGYKQVDPGLIDVVKQIALEGAAYPESRDKKLAATARELIRTFAFLGFVTLALAGYLAYLGHDVVALVVGLAPPGVGLVTTAFALVGRWWVQRRGRKPE